MITGLKAIWNSTPELDIYATMKDCEKDNEFTFNADKTYSVIEGATKCDASDPDEIESGTYELTDTYTKMVTTVTGGDVTTRTIESITATEIILKETVIEVGDTTHYTITMTPKM